MLQKAVIEPGSRLNRETHKILDDLRVKFRISDIEEIHTAKVKIGSPIAILSTSMNSGSLFERNTFPVWKSP